MPTYHARVQYTYSGTNNFAITFPYISASHVDVFVNNTAVDDDDITFLTSTTIRIDSPALVNGDVVVIRRRTSPTTRLVNWEGGSVLREADLDNDSLQAFYMAQEAMDRAEQAFALAGGTSSHP